MNRCGFKFIYFYCFYTKHGWRLNPFSLNVILSLFYTCVYPFVKKIEPLESETIRFFILISLHFMEEFFHHENTNSCLSFRAFVINYYFWVPPYPD